MLRRHASQGSRSDPIIKPSRAGTFARAKGRYDHPKPSLTFPRYACIMRRASILLLLLATPALAESGHDGIVRPRTAPELSDVALFLVAVAAVWLARRALRRRHAGTDGAGERRAED